MMESPRSTRARKVDGPGVSLAGQELPLDAQCLALSFLSLREHAQLMALSTGYQRAVQLSLERLPVATVEAKEERVLALRYCRRLQRLSFEYDRGAKGLVKKNAPTLRALHFLRFEPAPVPFGRKCRNLTELSTRALVSDQEAQHLPKRYPGLERLTVRNISLTILLSSKLPLRSLEVREPVLLPSHSPLLQQHRRLEQISLHPDNSFTSADYLALFRALQRLPKLRRLGLYRRTRGLISVTPSTPPKPIVFRELRSFHFTGDDERAVLPAFSAPLLETFWMPRVASLSIPDAMERFPSLTSFESPSSVLFSSDQEREATSQGLQQGVWRGLKQLRVRIASLPSISLLLPFVADSLETLCLPCPAIDPCSIRLLLTALPLLEHMGLYGQGGSPAPEAAASSVPPFSHARLKYLEITSVHLDRFGTALEVASFPALESVFFMSIVGERNVGPLLSRFPLLTSLDVEFSTGLTLALPEGAPRLEHLETVRVLACPLITREAVEAVAPNVASIEVQDEDDFGDEDSETDWEDEEEDEVEEEDGE